MGRHIAILPMILFKEANLRLLQSNVTAARLQPNFCSIRKAQHYPTTTLFMVYRTIAELRPLKTDQDVAEAQDAVDTQ